MLGLIFLAFAMSKAESSLNFRFPTSMPYGFKSPVFSKAKYVSTGALQQGVRTSATYLSKLYGPEKITLIPSFCIAAIVLSLLWYEALSRRRTVSLRQSLSLRSSRAAR